MGSSARVGTQVRFDSLLWREQFRSNLKLIGGARLVKPPELMVASLLQDKVRGSPLEECWKFSEETERKADSIIGVESPLWQEPEERVGASAEGECDGQCHPAPPGIQRRAKEHLLQEGGGVHSRFS